MKKTKAVKAFKEIAADSILKEWSDEKDYEFHSIANRFPLIEGEGFEKFADDIQTNGQKETVKLYEGQILDGRNRYRACKARKIPCRFEIWNATDDPWAYVLSINLHRRHLTPDQRKDLVIELRKEGKSIRQIADTVHTSYGSVHRDLETPTDPNGSVGNPEFPTTIPGKDGKARQARHPKKGKKPSIKNTKDAKNGNASAKGKRPKINELAAIIHRGLVTANEAEGLQVKKNTVFFQVHGYLVKVTCNIV